MSHKIRRMSAYLTRAIKAYLDLNTDDSGLAIERRAQLPRAAVNNIFRGHMPPPERLALLLGAVNDATACEWLAAYLRDHTPDDWQPRTHISVDSTAEGLAQTPAKFATERDRLTATLEWLRERTAGDDDLAEWLISTVELMRGMTAATDAPLLAEQGGVVCGGWFSVTVGRRLDRGPSPKMREHPQGRRMSGHR